MTPPLWQKVKSLLIVKEDSEKVGLTLSIRKTKIMASCPVSSVQFNSIQFSHSVVSTLCDPMNCSMSGLPNHHQLPDSTQTCVH